MNTTGGSAARDIMRYSFLVVFANDDTICEKELGMLTRLALKDGEVDDEERKVLSEIFNRADQGNLTDQVRVEIAKFRAEHNI